MVCKLDIYLIGVCTVAKFCYKVIIQFAPYKNFQAHVFLYFAYSLNDREAHLHAQMEEFKQQAGW